MPPKKKIVDERPVLLGRLGTNLKIGIVGLPNVGKSTFFNVLTNSSAPAENFPFCTIDPNESRVPVEDERFDFLVNFFKPASKVPAYLNVVDIAGLVEGAHEGMGLGNAFLSHISACDAIFHMSRVFDDSDVIHSEGEVDPLRDMKIIHNELRLKDLDSVNKKHESLEKAVRTNDKTKKFELEVIKKVKSILEDGKPIRFSDWSLKEIEELNKHLFITAKPMIYLVNMSKKDYIRKKNKWLLKIKQWIDVEDPGSMMIPFSGVFEQELSLQPEEERESFIKEAGATSCLSKIVTQGYKALQLMYYFTSGEDEVKAWTIQKNTKAPQAAGRIHTDFEKGFIMADIMKFEDFKKEGSETAVKAAGKYKQKGKEYIVEDGDIIHFKFNAGAGLTGKKKKVPTATLR